MPQSGERDDEDPVSASTALERAQDEMRKLEKVGDRRHTFDGLSKLAVFVVVTLAVGGLVVHTFFEERAPQIDSTTVALLAVALIAPFVPRLKALEIGGAKAEWQESAQVGLREILAVLQRQQEAIQKMYDDIGSTVATGPYLDSNESEIRAKYGVLPLDGPVELSIPTAEAGISPPRPIRNVLWIDGSPGISDNELKTLGKYVHVEVATSHGQAVEIIERNKADAVIEVVRSDSLSGMAITAEVAASRRLPVFIYTSLQLSFIPAGIPVTSVIPAVSFSELIGSLRRAEAAALEQFARTAAARIGELVASRPDRGVDVIVALPNGQRVGIEVASWLKRPQMSAFADRVGRIVDGLDAQLFSHAILLTQPDLVDERRRQWAAENDVEIVLPNELDAALLRLNRNSG